MNQIYAKCPDFVQREVAGECLLVPIHRRLADSNSIYVLNETGASLWRRLDGKSTLAQVVEHLHAEYEVAADQLQKDVCVLVDDLLSIKAIIPATP